MTHRSQSGPRRASQTGEAEGITIDGQWIRQLRDRLGLTQQQLAQMLGVHPMTVSRWERDLAQPPPYNTQQLLLMDAGVEKMDKKEIGRLMAMIATGLFVGALALIVGFGVDDIGKRRGWW